MAWPQWRGPRVAPPEQRARALPSTFVAAPSSRCANGSGPPRFDTHILQFFLQQLHGHASGLSQQRKTHI